MDCPIDKLERTGNNLVESAMKTSQGAKRVVDSVANLIKRDDRKYRNGTGLFIDWLMQIEPEIIGSSLVLQVRKNCPQTFFICTILKFFFVFL